MLEKIQSAGPSSIWRVINDLARLDEPRNRAEEREYRLDYVLALKCLLKRGHLKRVHRTFLCLPGQETVARERFEDEQNRKMAASICRAAANDLVRQYDPAEPDGANADVADPDENQSGARRMPCLARVADLAQTKTVEVPPLAVATGIETTVFRTSLARNKQPDHDQISQAARTLRSLPRKAAKRWTGWLHGCHFWRGRRVVLRDGQVVGVLWACRGKLLLQDTRDLPFRDWAVWAVRREHEVAVFKHPSAIALGKRKLGVRERRSEAKARAARANGRLPPRPGRKRGRPPAVRSIR